MATGNFLGRFSKQSTDALDYKFDFGDWLRAKGYDTIATCDVSITRYPPNTNVDPSPLQDMGCTFAGNVVTVWLANGSDGSQYNVACLITTVGGRTKTANILLRVANP
jgi:hypothetical protein